ncbi:MAG: plastocyanin/azurin family copper-binding protein [Vicinamibacterales bacterium]
MAALVGSLAVPVFVPACAPAKEPPAAPPAAAAVIESAAGLSTVTGTAASGAVVSLTPTTAREFPLPEGPAILDQYGKQFVPGLLAVRVGQAVEFRNSDEFGHNVIVNRRSTGASVFNVSLDTQQAHTHVFERAGEYAVTCDIHPGMMATVFATTSPFTVQVGPSGTFAIRDVPPGTYTAALVPPSGGLREENVVVSGPQTVLKLTP